MVNKTYNNTRPFRLKLNRKTDADVIARLESVSNMQGYIKSLIRQDIADMQDIPDDRGKLIKLIDYCSQKLKEGV